MPERGATRGFGGPKPKINMSEAFGNPAFETSFRGLSDKRAYRVHCEGTESSGFLREASAPSKSL